jgi:uncharacterized membrane protein YoaK (UPF0700 family)
VNSPSRWSAETRRNVLVVVLIVASGSVDAVGFLRLGGVFTSVMTANMVLLGVSAGTRDAALAMHAGTAFGGYILGSYVGSLVSGHPEDDQPVWPERVSVTLTVELAVLAVFAAWWEATGGHPPGAETYGLLAVNATALGIQSAAVLRFGVPGLSTTYLTGTLTQFVASLSRGRFRTQSLASLLAVVSGGAVGAVLAVEAPRFMPIVPLGVVALVLAGSLAALPSRRLVCRPPGTSLPIPAHRTTGPMRARAPEGDQ